jgi:hypothetical protein
MKLKFFFCQFPNPWTLRVSGIGCYTSKCEKSQIHCTLMYSKLYGHQSNTSSKKLTCKGTLRQVFICMRLGFCLGCSSKLLGSESCQIQRVKLLQNMVSNQRFSQNRDKTNFVITRNKEVISRNSVSRRMAYLVLNARS